MNSSVIWVMADRNSALKRDLEQPGQLKPAREPSRMDYATLSVTNRVRFRGHTACSARLSEVMYRFELSRGRFRIPTPDILASFKLRESLVTARLLLSF
jgi:hypothetical protein